MSDSENESISGSIKVDGLPFWYEKFGSGPKPLLLIPGGIGTGRTDYLPQLEDEDALDQTQFTIIAVELQGWGRSVPPERKYGCKIYDHDAKCCYQLMKEHFGYNRFSVIAWSDGTKGALTLATKHPEVIESMVMLGMEVTNAKSVVKWLNSIIDMETWGPQKIECYMRAYHSRERIQELWKKFVKSTEYLSTYFGDDMFKGKYHLIKCPVLIIIGEKDNVSSLAQCQMVSERLKNAKLIRFPTGGHDVHLRYPTLFKEIVEKHLLRK